LLNTNFSSLLLEEKRETEDLGQANGATKEGLPTPKFQGVGKQHQHLRIVFVFLA
jgi:hypothetical protein